MKIRLLTAAIPLFLIGCASWRPTLQESIGPTLASWRIEEPTGELIHVASGYRFAKERQGCERVNPHVYDESGENVSVGYNCPNPTLWLTVYIYPTAFGDTPNPSEHFRLVISEALAFHEKAKVDIAAEMPLPLGTRTVNGFNAFLHWSENKESIGSFAVLIPDGNRFVKVRTSFVLDESDESALPLKRAWDLTLDVLRSVGPSP